MGIQVYVICKQRTKKHYTTRHTNLEDLENASILLTVALSTNMSITFRFFVKGILFFAISFSHFSARRVRNAWLNGPE